MDSPWRHLFRLAVHTQLHMRLDTFCARWRAVSEWGVVVLYGLDLPVRPGSSGGGGAARAGPSRQFLGPVIHKREMLVICAAPEVHYQDGNGEVWDLAYGSRLGLIRPPTSGELGRLLPALGVVRACYGHFVSVGGSPPSNLRDRDCPRPGARGGCPNGPNGILVCGAAAAHYSWPLAPGGWGRGGYHRRAGWSSCPAVCLAHSLWAWAEMCGGIHRGDRRASPSSWYETLGWNLAMRKVAINMLRSWRTKRRSWGPRVSYSPMYRCGGVCLGVARTLPRECYTVGMGIRLWTQPP